MNNSLKEFEHQHVWHPYDSLNNAAPVIDIVKTEGTKLFLADGRVLVDGMSSWWAACHGYGNPIVVEAIEKQLHTMSHVMFAGITHSPAATLAEKLSEMTPQGLDDVFFADSGSVAVEVALKMAIQYQSSKHPSRTKFLTVRGGYHGDTLGAMSVTDPDGGINTSYQNYTPKEFFIERPRIKFGEKWDPAALDPLREALEKHHDEIAAFIIEPIMQGAGGMYFYHPEYLKGARELLSEHDVIFICDEIATGFGRTGELFACNYAGISPDIMTLGKGLTAGMMTLSAVMTSEKIRNGISYSPAKVMMHGPTFMANPLACACAIGSIEALHSYDWQTKVRNIEKLLYNGLKDLASSSLVKEVRALGACGVVEMHKPVNTVKVQQFLIKEGVWLRPFGHIIYIYPPFVSSDADIQKSVDAVHKLIKAMEDGSLVL